MSASAGSEHASTAQATEDDLRGLLEQSEARSERLEAEMDALEANYAEFRYTSGMEAAALRRRAEDAEAALAEPTMGEKGEKELLLPLVEPVAIHVARDRARAASVSRLLIICTSSPCIDVAHS